MVLGVLMIKINNWKGNDLSGKWVITTKLDGVRCIVTDGVALSRAGKPLYNIPKIPDGDYEVFIEDWNHTVSKVRTKNGEAIDERHLYDLIDANDLHVTTLSDPLASIINALFKEAIRLGYEGLVLRQGDKWLKVKASETHDVEILDIIEGKGRNAGSLGAFLTTKGKVGTGFTDELRSEYFTKDLIGTIIEVECMSLTVNGKFRHPRFLRLRFDK